MKRDRTEWVLVGLLTLCTVAQALFAILPLISAW